MHVSQGAYRLPEATAAPARQRSTPGETPRQTTSAYRLVEQMTVGCRWPWRKRHSRKWVSATDIKRWNHLRRAEKVPRGRLSASETFERITIIKGRGRCGSRWVTPQTPRGGATEAGRCRSQGFGPRRQPRHVNVGQDAARIAFRRACHSAKHLPRLQQRQRKAARRLLSTGVRKGDNLKIAATARRSPFQAANLAWVSPPDRTRSSRFAKKVKSTSSPPSS